MAAEVSVLAAGLPGAVVISVFSSVLGANSGFVVPRTIPATAISFSEPDITVPGTSISRRTSTDPSLSGCSRPIIPLGKAVNSITTTAQAFPAWLLGNVAPWLIMTLAPPLLRPSVDTALTRLSNYTDTAVTIISSIYSAALEKISLYKTAALDKARLSCFLPILIRPFEPILEHFRCKLGISEDPYMEAPPCDPAMCSTSEIEDREITMSKPIPSMVLMNVSVETIDDCFQDMQKLKYGARVLIKTTDDESCDDPRFSDTCQNLFEENKVIMEDTCASPRYEKN